MKVPIYLLFIWFTLTSVKPLCAQSDFLKLENKAFSEIERLIKSKRPEDRIEGAERIIGMDSSRTPVDFVTRLTNDTRMQVRKSGFRALHVVIGNGSLKIAEAIKFSGEIEAALEANGLYDFRTEKTFKGDILIANQVACLNQLKIHFPLTSISQFQVWQIEYYAEFLIRILKSPPEGDDFVNTFGFLMNGLIDPSAIVYVIEVFSKESQHFDEREIQRLLAVLCGHRVVGVDGPMNENLISIIREKQDLVERITRIETNEYYLSQLLGKLNSNPDQKNLKNGNAKEGKSPRHRSGKD